jgi:hypothetical protein
LNIAYIRQHFCIVASLKNIIFAGGGYNYGSGLARAGIRGAPRNCFSSAPFNATAFIPIWSAPFNTSDGVHLTFKYNNGEPWKYFMSGGWSIPICDAT